MLLNQLYNENNIIGYSMQSMALKNEIIQNNIANAELPNFKKSNVIFEESLQKEVDNFKNKKELNLENVKPKVVVEHKNLSYRLDGNNVDIETEMTKLYENDAKYSTLASAVMNNYKRINLVLASK